MNIEDYDAPETIADKYAPRKDASQKAARASRERQHDETKDEGRRTKDEGRIDPRIAGVVGLLVVAGVFAGALSQFSNSGPIKIAPTDAPARMSQTSSVAAPAPFSAPPATPAQNSPSPVPAAPVEPAPVIAPQTGRGMPAEGVPEVVPAPEIVPEPTATIVWPTSAPAVRDDFAKPDIRDTCTFIGCVGGELAAKLARANQCHALFWMYEGAEDMAEPDYSMMRACVWEDLYR